MCNCTASTNWFSATLTLSLQFTRNFTNIASKCHKLYIIMTSEKLQNFTYIYSYYVVIMLDGFAILLCSSIIGSSLRGNPLSNQLVYD